MEQFLFHVKLKLSRGDIKLCADIVVLPFSLWYCQLSSLLLTLVCRYGLLRLIVILCCCLRIWLFCTD